ncbi:VOC family protein [Lentzea albida]|uniref:3,4-dihydroxy-9,10-secoandrosta-1,3,5(10)-triene-9,17-dione 4,5-dioxygenase n=1 Tax=Lentzea albida TaxID=65499 RepID=A0A1H9K598_9PSEU|nr:VOC family protein [Lentzea albida]SEQ94035.1 3,4-dihydroxy-9,10-secoandrosta-1,3,5(10)-triene-9,17-dione 4,5-dioxygenase [Lentzea albida]
MGIRKLGYVGLNVTDVDAWTDLLWRTLGVGVTDAKSGTETIALAEMDEFKYRVALYPSGVDSPREIGWVVDTPAELDRLTHRLTAAGYTVADGTDDERDLRGATHLRWFTDPAGFRVELAIGETKVRVAADRPAGGPGITGLGHLVLATPHLTELRHLYETVLEFRLTDYRSPGLFFFRCNTTHHSIALGTADTASIHHLEFEHATIDDVGRAHDRAHANNVPVSISLGRHMNDKAISFYVKNPSGFHLEIGCGGITVDDDWVPHDFGQASVWGHRHTDTNPFAVKDS